MCEALDGVVLIVCCHKNTGALEIKYFLIEYFLAVLVLKYELCLALAGNSELCALVDIAVSVTSYSDRLLPCSYVGENAGEDDGLSENGTVEHSTDSTVRALIHLVEVVLLYTLCVRCDSSALYTYVILFDCVCCILCDLVMCLVSLYEAEIVVLCLEINIGEKKIVLDHLPNNSGHFVAVDFNDRCCHTYFCHNK